MYKAVNLRAALDGVTEHWSPRVVGQLNDHYVKVVKLQGQFVWHQHDGEDEMFYVVKGRMRIEYRDGAVELNEGEFHIVPRGTMHNPVAEEECWIALLEPAVTKHTGDLVTERTRSIDEQLSGSSLT